VRRGWISGGFGLVGVRLSRWQERCGGGVRVLGEGLYTLFVHALLDGVFVVGLGGILECAAEACRGHFREFGGVVLSWDVVAGYWGGCKFI
jgi:hypothetical protein